MDFNEILKKFSLADQRVIKLMDPALMQKLPPMAHGKATKEVITAFAQKAPDIYKAFGKEEEPAGDLLEKAKAIINEALQKVTK